MDDLQEFRGRVVDVLLRVREAYDADPTVSQQVLPQDLRELLAIVRSAASELILCASVDEAIDRLKQDLKELRAVEYVATTALSDREIDLAIFLAHAKAAQDNTPALPCVPFCSYLIELCNGLKPGKEHDAPPESSAS